MKCYRMYPISAPPLRSGAPLILPSLAGAFNPDDGAIHRFLRFVHGFWSHSPSLPPTTSRKMYETLPALSVQFVARYFRATVHSPNSRCRPRYQEYDRLQRKIDQSRLGCACLVKRRNTPYPMGRAKVDRSTGANCEGADLSLA